MNIIIYMARPFRESFGQWQVAMKTQAGNVHLHCQWANGEFQAPFVKAIRSLEGGAGFHRLGFHLHGTADLLEDELEEQDLMADKMVRLCLALINMRLTTLLPYCWGLPEYFVLLLDPRPAVVSAALAKLKTFWELLVEAEKLSINNSLARESLKAALWPKWIWVREQLVLLSKCQLC